MATSSRKTRKAKVAAPANRPIVVAPATAVHARYEAAMLDRQNQRNWEFADALSADAALSADVRHRIINRARYEAANNGYLDGILSTLSADVVGTGPRLQLSAGDNATVEQERAMDARERRFSVWAKSILLTHKLRVARRAKAIDGECFLVKHDNPKVRNECKLDVELYEAEQVGSPFGASTEIHRNGEPREVDGIVYDSMGNPTSYRFWLTHPGSDTAGNQSHLRNAASVIHYANIVRPGQHRGVSEIASTLTLYNDIRRYRKAVVASAEVAADMSFLLKTTNPPVDENGETVQQHLEPGSIIEIARNQGMSLPEGWDVQQLKPEQPTETFAEFLRTQIREAARSLSMPLNVALGDSSQYNYASGRLDHQTYYRRIRDDREHIETVILSDLLAEWEAWDSIYHGEDYGFDTSAEWMWDGFAHVDPAKEANALVTRLASGTTTLAIECAKEGRDWKAVMIQRAREKALSDLFGLSSAEEPAKSGEEENV